MSSTFEQPAPPSSSTVSRADPDDDQRLQRSELMAGVVSLVWLGVAVVWTVRFWSMLRDAAPVIAMFEAEAGGPLTEQEWYHHQEARDIFCPHPDTDPSTNRIGRYIGATWAYIPVLVMGGIPAWGSGAVLAMLTSEARRWWVRRVPVMIGIAILLQLAVFITEADTIQTLSWITE